MKIRQHNLQSTLPFKIKRNFIFQKKQMIKRKLTAWS